MKEDKNINIVLDLRNVAILTEEQIRRYISRRHMYNLLKNNYIERRFLFDNDGYKKTCFTLGKAGKALINKLGITRFYKGAGAKHDTAYAELYLSLNLTEKEKQSYLVENEVRDLIEEVIEKKIEKEIEKKNYEKVNHYNTIKADGINKHFSPTDGAYVRADGKIICVELVTDNYSKAQVEAKKKCAEILEAEIKIEKI